MTERLYKVMYRLKVGDQETAWQLLVLNKLYSASIAGPDLLTTLHWRMGDIAKALEKVESEVVRVCEFKLVEITAKEALRTHQEVCEECRTNQCFAGKRLREALQFEPPVRIRTLDD